MTGRHAVALGPATVDQVTKSCFDVAAILAGRDLISLNPLPFPGGDGSGPRRGVWQRWPTHATKAAKRPFCAAPLQQTEFTLVRNAFTDEQARTTFLMLMLTGPRRTRSRRG
jgi:hypothetical protein